MIKKYGSNKMKKLFLSVSLCLFCFGALFAGGLENKNAIGVYVVGAERPICGIQYERRFNDFIGMKFGTFAFYNKDSEENPFDLSFTLETDFTLFQSEWKDKIASRLFAFCMVGYETFYGREIVYDNGPQVKSEKFHNNAMVNAGFGFDFIFFGHLSVPLQFGFMGYFPDDTSVGFSGGIALRYSW